jgi:hypothetical protein
MAAVAALQRLAGNRAATALLAGAAAGPPLQRQIVTGKSKKTPVTWSELQAIGTVTSASAAVRMVIQFWAETSFPATPVQFTTAKALVELAKKKAKDMPAEFADRLDRAQLEEFRDSMTRLKVIPGPGLQKALEDREQVLMQGWIGTLGPNPVLPEPSLDSRYKTPQGWEKKPAADSGRDDAEWHPVTNSMPGVSGKKTGSTNLWLAEEAVATNALRLYPGGAVEICKTCGKPVDATQFEVDHQQAFSEIRDNLLMLAQAMALDATLFASIKSGANSFDSLFMTTGKPGQPGCKVVLTAAAINLYSNDIPNLMRICRKCNGAWGKSDMVTLDWYRKSPYFGEIFLAATAATGSQGEVIARTKTGEGWGQAARSWFADKHLPILRRQFDLEEIGRFLHSQLTEQSTTALAATVEPDPTKKTELLDRGQALDASNTAFLGGLTADHAYFSGGSRGEVPALWAPPSPARWEAEHKELATTREKRKRGEKLSRTGAYAAGLAEGDANVPAVEAAYLGDADALAAYRQGYQLGQAQYQARHDGGFRAAIALDPQVDIVSAANQVQDAATHAGFTAAATQRIWWYNAGHAAGQASQPPDVTAVPSGTVGSEALLRDYIRGYGAGMASRAPVLTTTAMAISQV